MKKLLEAFEGSGDKNLIGFLGDACNLAEHLRLNDKTFEDVRQYLKDAKSNYPQYKISERRVRRLIHPCIECGKPMSLYPVNTCNEDQVNKEYNSMWLCGTSCNRQGCWYEEYNKESVNEILAKLIGGGK